MSADDGLRGNCWCEAYKMPEWFPHRPSCLNYKARTEAAAAGDVPSPTALGSPDQTLVAVGGRSPPPCGKKFCPRQTEDPLCEPCAHEAIGRLRNTNETLFTERQEALRREDRQRLRAEHLQAAISSVELICKENGKLPNETVSGFLQRFAAERHTARRALAFYAQEDLWNDANAGEGSTIEDDRGAAARRALGMS